jgi:hypothetical protein
MNILNKLMTFLQKVSFCKLIRNNPRLFPAYLWKKIVIAVVSLICISIYPLIEWIIGKKSRFFSYQIALIDFYKEYYTNLIVLFTLIFHLISVPLESSEVKINVNQKNIIKILDRIRLKNINSLYKFTSEYEGERNISYTNCGSDFPELPGNFPCSFLSDEFFSESLSVGSSPGGTVFIQKAINKSEFGGSVFIVSSGEEEEFNLKLYYSKDRYIRAYTYKNRILLFHWVGKENKSLIEIFKLRMNENKEIQSIRRIRFDD